MDCEKCEEAREMGYNRPTCEECMGDIDSLDEDSLYYLNIISEHFSLIFDFDGFGSMSINLAAVDFISKQYFADKFMLIKCVEIAKIKHYQTKANKEEEKEKNMPDPTQVFRDKARRR